MRRFEFSRPSQQFDHSPSSYLASDYFCSKVSTVSTRGTIRQIEEGSVLAHRSVHRSEDRQHSILAKHTAERSSRILSGRDASSIRRRKRSGSFWKACAARTASPSCAAARVSRRPCTIAGRRTSWRLARSAWPVTRLAPQLRTRSRICGARRPRSRRLSPI